VNKGSVTSTDQSSGLNRFFGRLRRSVLRSVVGVAVVLGVIIFVALESSHSTSTNPPTNALSTASSTPASAMTPAQICAKYHGYYSDVPGADGSSSTCEVLIPIGSSDTGKIDALFDPSGRPYPNACLDNNWAIENGATDQPLGCNLPPEKAATAKADCLSASGDYYPPESQTLWPPPYHWYAALDICAPVPLPS
jgi:hypothetical protein